MDKLSYEMIEDNSVLTMILRAVRERKKRCFFSDWWMDRNLFFLFCFFFLVNLYRCEAWSLGGATTTLPLVDNIFLFSTKLFPPLAVQKKIWCIKTINIRSPIQTCSAQQKSAQKGGSGRSNTILAVLLGPMQNTLDFLKNRQRRKESCWE